MYPWRIVNVFAVQQVSYVFSPKLTTFLFKNLQVTPYILFLNCKSSISNTGSRGKLQQGNQAQFIESIKQHIAQIILTTNSLQQRNEKITQNRKLYSKRGVLYVASKFISCLLYCPCSDVCNHSDCILLQLFKYYVFYILINCAPDLVACHRHL